MEIIINGKTEILQKPMNVLELLEFLVLSKSQVAIERNGEIVPRSRYGEVLLSAGDRLEVVTFIGGG